MDSQIHPYGHLSFRKKIIGDNGLAELCVGNQNNIVGTHSDFWSSPADICNVAFLTRFEFNVVSYTNLLCHEDMKSGKKIGQGVLKG